MADIEKFARATVAVTLWDDNPAVVDLLGFDAVVAPVLAALRQPDLDPKTVGVRAPWGGGKSSLLNLIESAAESKWIVVRTSPWEYEDQLDGLESYSFGFANLLSEAGCLLIEANLQYAELRLWSSGLARRPRRQSRLHPRRRDRDDGTRAGSADCAGRGSTENSDLAASGLD